MYKLRAPASSANIGSGFDSIGIALNLYNYVTFEESDEILVECEDEVPKDGTNLIVDTVRKVYAQAGRTFRGLHVIQENHVPMVRGLGSSSTCIAAGVSIAGKLMGDNLSLHDKVTLAAMSERILSRMLEAGEAEQDGTGRIGGVRQADDAPGQPLSERECRERLLSRLYRRGGAHFEVFLANALEKYFLVTGRDVTCCEITGGSADGGIDIVIDTVDELGFAEHILVQAK